MKIHLAQFGIAPDERLLALDRLSQRSQLLIELRQRFRPHGAIRFDDPQNRTPHGRSLGGIEVVPFQLKQQDLDRVQIAIPELDGGSLISVRIDQGRGIVVLLAQIRAIPNWE